jgi:protein involved in polysaccharide export with SLBB domain
VVAGLNADSLTGLISSRYAGRIVDAVVDVGIVRSLPVLGDVASPGVYQAEPAMTLQQVVAKAGGMRVRSLRTPVALLQKGRDGTRYSLALDQRLDRVPLDEGDAIVVFDPGILERWGTALDYIYRVGMVLTILSSVLVLTRK